MVQRKESDQTAAAGHSDLLNCKIVQSMHHAELLGVITGSSSPIRKTVIDLVGPIFYSQVGCQLLQ
jgi:hypothetical protein